MITSSAPARLLAVAALALFLLAPATRAQSTTTGSVEVTAPVDPDGCGFLGQPCVDDRPADQTSPGGIREAPTFTTDGTASGGGDGTHIYDVNRAAAIRDQVNETIGANQMARSNASPGEMGGAVGLPPNERAVAAMNPQVAQGGGGNMWAAFFAGLAAAIAGTS